MNQLETALYNAAAENETEKLSALLKEDGYNINFQTDTGDTLLHAVKSKEAAEIVMAAGIDLSIQNNEGMTALGKHFKKVYMPHYEEIVLSMLKNGADINANAFFDEPPVIHIANNATTLSANIEQLQFLVRAGADINKKNSQGFTALMLAVIKNNIDMVYALLDAGADRNIKDSKGRTAKDIGQSLIDSGYYVAALKSLINDM